MKKIVMIFIVSCFYTSSLLANTSLNFETKTISKVNDNPKYLLKINFPQIKKPINPAQKQFNNMAKKWAVDRSKEFKKALNDWNTDQLPPEIKANGSSLTINYDLTTLDPQELVSVRFSADSYYVGAAHPSHVYSSLNYDLVNNKVLALRDLFKPNSNYLQYIAMISTNKLTTKLNADANGKADIFKEGLAPNEKNYSVWNITPNGVKITFNEYQVAAYVFGPQEVTIPYQHLMQYLNNKSALYKCFSNNSCEFTVKSASK